MNDEGPPVSRADEAKATEQYFRAKINNAFDELQARPRASPIARPEGPHALACGKPDADGVLSARPRRRGGT